MAVLSVDIQANIEKLVALRDEVSRLENELKKVGKNTPKSEIKDLEKQLANARNEFNSLAGAAAESGKQMESFGSSLTKMAGMVGGVAALKNLASQVVRVRGEFQDMEVALETLVGKATVDKIMPEIREMAKVSPLTMGDIIGAEKTMLSFNIDAEKSVQYLKALSDVSMGSSQKFNSLALAFSQMSSAGKLMGQDLMQMINAGFNPLQTISDKTGKSIAQLKEEMSKGAISAEMVQQAFIDATSAGGKFYNMSANAAKTINGQISMMEDAWDTMLNEIGMQQEGLIIDGIQFVTTLIQNYEKVGKVLVSLVATYGAYRTAVMLATIQTEGLTIAEAALTKVRTLAKKAQDLLNASMLKNPYVLLTTVIMGTVTALWALRDTTTLAEETQKSYDEAKEDTIKKEREHADAIQGLINKVNDETQALVDRQAALLALQSEYPHIFAQYDLESLKLADILEIKRQINEADALSRKGRVDADLKQGMKELEAAMIREEITGEDRKTKRLRAKFLSSQQLWLDENLQSITSYIEKLSSDELRTLIEEYKEGTTIFRNLTFLKGAIPKSEGSYKSGTTWEYATQFVKDPKIINLLEIALQARDAQSKRQADLPIYGVDYETAKKEWEEAKKKLDEIKKDKHKYTTDEYKLAVADEKKKRDAFKALGGEEKDAKEKAKKEAKAHNDRRARLLKMQAQSKKDAEDAARNAKDLYFMEEQARIDAMRDGAEKRHAQRKLDNAKELDALERQKQDYVNKAVERERAAFEAAEEEKARQDETYRMGTFDEEAAAKRVDTGVYDRVISYTRQKQAQQQDEVLKNLLDSYQSYEDKKQAITLAYLEDYDELQSAYTETGDEKYKRSLDERYKAYVKAMNDLEQEMNTADYKLIFGDPSRMTAATIDKALDAARKKLQSLDKEADPETFQALSEAIERLEDARDNNPFEGWNSDLMGIIQTLYQMRNLRKDIAKYQEEGNEEAMEASEAELQKAKIDLAKSLAATGVSKFGEALSTAASSMRQVAETAGDMNLMEQAEALERAGNFVSSVASGAASGGWIGAVVGGASSLMDMLVQSLTESEVVAAEAKKAFEDYIDELAHAARTINNEDYETIFGVRTLDKVVDAAKAAKTAYEDFSDALKATGQTYSTNNVRRFQDSLQNMLVFEGQSWGTDKKLKNIKTLSEKFTNLFDAQGNLNLEEAEAILKAYSKYSGEEWYQALEDATNALTDYENNLKIVDEYLSSLFSNVGNEIADAIMQGNDALEVLEKNAGQIFASIAKEMIVSALISKDFIDKYKQMLREAVATEGAEDDAAVLEGFVQELKGNIEDAKAKWDEIQAIAEAHGLDMDLEAREDQSASRKGYQTLSEDTGNELVGRAIAQYESNLRMEGSMRDMKDSIDLMASNYIQIRDIAAESRAIIASSYLELQQIRDNTGSSAKQLKQITERMAEWDTKIKSL